MKRKTHFHTAATLLLLLLAATQAFSQDVPINNLVPQGQMSSLDTFGFKTGSTVYGGMVLTKQDGTIFGENNSLSLFTHGNRDLTFYSGTGNIIFFPNVNNANSALSDIGKVGIGTKTPESILQIAKQGSTIDFLNGDDLTGQYAKAWINIHGKTGGAIRFTNQTTDDKTTIFSNNGSLVLVAGKEMKFGVGASQPFDRLIINENGNVGIGTGDGEALYAKLSVNGDIRSKEVRVEIDNWPDYVFAEDYELTSLEETAEFIQANHHLPEVPSAAEIEEEGMDVGEMNKLLLKKIEELTLHVIQQQEKIDRLEGEEDFSKEILKRLEALESNQ